MGSRFTSKRRDKTEFTIVGRKDCAQTYHYSKLWNRDFGGVEWFKYLRSILTGKNEIETEEATRALSGNKCFFGLFGVATSRYDHKSRPIIWHTEQKDGLGVKWRKVNREKSYGTFLDR